MKKLLTSLVLFSPLSVFADNLVFNGGFDMTPWDTGWTKTDELHGDAGAYAKFSSTLYYSIPQSCSLYAYAYYHPSQPARASSIIYQKIQPSVSCTCKVSLYRFCNGGWAAGMFIHANINNENTSLAAEACVENDTAWIKKEFIFNETDTLSEISFEATSDPSTAGSPVEMILLIDDVYISGKEIGVEEKSNIKNQISKIEAFPNPFIQQTVIRYSGIVGLGSKTNIQVYDVAGKLVEETKDNIIGKDLNTGIYFAKLNTDKNNTFVKLIKLK
ncbi:MAG: T9SS type A sorting domain-containing protein [bacterium]|nr:T9SS type A sorting domain-containing protein [bacterium]